MLVKGGTAVHLLSPIYRPTMGRVCTMFAILSIWYKAWWCIHYSDIIMNVMASQITSVSMVCSNICSGADKKKHHSSTSLAFVRGIHRWPVNSPHKGQFCGKCFHLIMSSWYASVKWYPWTGLPLIHLTACLVPCHYINQCWLTIN